VPNVSVRIDLATFGSRSPSDNRGLREAIRFEVEQKLMQLLETLGIPAFPSVEVIDNLPTTTPSILSVRINGSLCRYPVELLERAYSYVADKPLGPSKRNQDVIGLIQDAFIAARPSSTAGEQFAEFVGLVCTEIASRRARLWLTQEVVAAYAESLPGDPVDLESLERILGTVVGQRISVGARTQIAACIAEQSRSPATEVSERLIDAIGPEVVEIQFSPQTLERMTRDHVLDGPDAFRRLREFVVRDSGVTYPPFCFVAADTLRANSFAFRLNHLVTMPSAGLASDRCLINATVDDLRSMNIRAIRTRNPVTGYENSIAAGRGRDKATAAGLATWDSLEYLILSLTAALRDHSAIFVNAKDIEHQLVLLGDAFPALVDMARNYVSAGQLARLARSLLSEGVPIRNLRLMLEVLLDYVLLHPEEELNEVDVLRFVRIGMKREIRNRVGEGRTKDTLVACLLDSVFERSLEATDVVDENLRESFVLAVAKTVAALSDSVSSPVLLTTARLRPVIRALLVDDLPDVRVIARNEVSPEMNIQPVAEVSVPT
jgi:flagellar biosynthesis component FlhA